ncbi:hypothetical protein [Marinobacter sp. 2_MG-2023]|uniref:hypothetical protein n=1 Tax=Marinobacter sp. 2_MG-2023 TaxID=3062679 RepID=UPI0026E3C699|nr:hypothetical protein [Marinobacter sp. 2_MG-2023]MDO6442948.1 hypothetical protein [Marinobacter sp. 2_MG-2023]
MENGALTFWEYALMVSLPTGLLSVIFIVTVAFPRIADVERRIGTAGKLIDSVRLSFGGGPIGRWMRSLHVFAFFAFRKIPKYGSKISARYGDEVEPLSLSLKLWATFPHIVFFLSGVVFFSVGLSLDFS